MQFPIFIITRDRVSHLKDLMEWLTNAGLSRIYIIDNDSTYEPMVDYLRELRSEYTVLFRKQNGGHTIPWTGGYIDLFTNGDEYYVVTDPDVIPVETCPYNAVDYLYEIHQQYPGHNKVGLGLKIDDIPDHYQHKARVVAYEQQFWSGGYNIAGTSLYGAPIDTTFALYTPTSTQEIGNSIRTGDKYVARHMSWYADTSNLDEEERHYRSRLNPSIASWSKEEGPHWA